MQNRTPLNVGDNIASTLNSNNEILNKRKQAPEEKSSSVMVKKANVNPGANGQISGKLNDGTGKSLSRVAIGEPSELKRFRKILASRNMLEIEAMWDSSALLRSYLKGMISPEIWISCFKKALVSRCHLVIQSMWQGNDLMQGYFIGEALNFGTEKRQPTEVERAENIEKIFASQNPWIIRAVWDKAKTSVFQHQIQQKLVEKACSASKSNASFRTVHACIKTVTDIHVLNSLLTTISNDHDVNDAKQKLSMTVKNRIKYLTNFTQLKDSPIPPPHILAKAKTLSLISTQAEINLKRIDEMWERILELHDSRCENVELITEAEIAEFKKLILVNSHVNAEEVNQKWRKSLALQNYFCGKEMNFGTDEKPDIRKITPVDWLVHVGHALSGGYDFIAQEILEGNLLMREYFYGEIVDFGTQIKPDIQQITSKEWLNCFEAISNCGGNTSAIIEKMYGFIGVMTDVDLLENLLKLLQESNLAFVKEGLKHILSERILILKALNEREANSMQALMTLKEGGAADHLAGGSVRQTSGVRTPGSFFYQAKMTKANITTPENKSVPDHLRSQI